MRSAIRPATLLWMLALLAATPVAHAAPAAPASGLALRGIAFPAASIDEADSIAERLGFERLVRTGPGWRVISRLRNGSLLWYAAGHDTAIGGHGDPQAVPLFTGLEAGVDVGLPVGVWTEAEGKAEAMPHRNGAIEIEELIAEVPSLAVACEAWRRAGAVCRAHADRAGSRLVELPGGGRIVLITAVPRENNPPNDLRFHPRGVARWVGIKIAIHDSTVARPSSGPGVVSGLRLTFVLVDIPRPRR